MTKINIVLEEKFLKKIDSFSAVENMTRSGFIREAVANYIVEKEEERKLREKANLIQDSINFFKKMGEKNKNWDGIGEVNRARERK